MSCALEPWPSWSNRWFGIVVRVVVGVVGVLLSAVMVWGASLSAVFAGNLRQSVWEAGAIALFWFGIAVFGGSIWLAVRPSRASLLNVLAIVAMAILVLSLL